MFAKSNPILLHFLAIAIFKSLNNKQTKEINTDLKVDWVFIQPSFNQWLKCNCYINAPAIHLLGNIQ